MTLVELRVAVGPLLLVAVVSVIVPLKWFRLERNRVEDPPIPASMLTMGCEVVRPKSETLTNTEVDAENEGPEDVALTIIVESPFPEVVTCKVV